MIFLTPKSRRCAKSPDFEQLVSPLPPESSAPQNPLLRKDFEQM